MNPSDPTLELREIKPAVEIPEVAGWPLWATLTLVALGIAIVAAIAFWQRSRRRNQTPARTPMQIAFDEFEAIKNSTADAETYVMRVSSVLRRYIEVQFQIAAPQLTTEEFLERLSTSNTDAIDPSALSYFLRQCDQVKFARGQLDESQRGRLYDVARSLVQTSHPEQTGGEPVAPIATLQPSH